MCDSSFEKAADQTHHLWAKYFLSSRPLSTSHSRAVLSNEPVSSRRLSREKATETTSSACPTSFRTGAPVLALKICTWPFWSLPPSATYLPSGENATV